ncbi:MAG: hypothetical protein KDD36_01365 [Flavobacteriales bacterium]|nr:hypothetical protein [Flavobacteriales bacterium]
MILEGEKTHQAAWTELTTSLGEKFADGDVLSMEAVLFLIGVNELGEGFRRFSKDEKMELVHIAVCVLLSQEGYYRIIGKDDRGWPVWENIKPLPELTGVPQEKWIQELAVKYFEP